jgi:hypothetical protein
MNNSLPTPARISYSDGEEKTIVFPEISRGGITDIKVDGERIMQIHDLAKNVTRQNQQIRFMAIIATTMAFFVLLIVGGIGLWLQSHESAIERVLLTGNHDFDVMQDQARDWRSHKRQRAWVHLEHHQGLYWDEGMQDWVNPYYSKK